ncbi:heterokaryon incompatibility protein-domain-containing protein [Paraphoma chrysanthemicola]|nr:heterokaryon incompatibility protein-domain-containing protein [Paraphoma chrysanthemicola]
MLDVPVLERDFNRRFMFMSPAERPEWYIVNPAHLPPTHPDFLCGTCRHIDFIKLFEQEETNVLPHRKYYISLGSFMEMSARKECPFCSFAIRVMTHHMLLEKKLHRAELEEKRAALLQSDLFAEKFYICPIRYANTHRIPLLYFCTEADLPSVSRRKSIATKAVRYGLPRTMSFRPMHKTQSKLGRFTKRDTIDFEWIKERMILCDERSASRRYKNSPHLRAINVKSLSIDNVSTDARYCTLSYVWGDAQHFKLSKSNVQGFRKPGSLNKVFHLFPKTIQDAITLTRQIGETYLWVDALCIIQDDDVDKAVQIDSMGVIYRQSVLCIQALCGVDSTYGLPGVAPGTRAVQQFATRLACSRGNLLLSNQLPTADKDATWATRAWTLQEKILSQRMLLITDDSVTWWCWHTETLEDENCRHQLWPKGTAHTEMTFFTTEHDLVISKIPKGCNFDIYAFTIFDYTQRNVKFQEDAERACQGVLDVFSRSHRANCVFGLPDTAMDAALLWCPIGSAVRRLDQYGRPLFPSWSWLGWKGAAAYPWLIEREFPMSTKGSPLLWEDASLQGEAKWFTSLELRHSASPSRRTTQDPFENWTLDPEDPWVYSTDFQEQLRWIHPVSQEHYLGGRRAFHYTVGKSHRLKFVTLSASFELAQGIIRRPENYDYTQPLYQQRVLDRWGFSVGYIYTPNPDTMPEPQRKKFRGRQEFLVMSRSSIVSDPRMGAERLDQSIYQMPALRPRNIPPPQDGNERLHNSAYFNTDRYDASYPWCMFNVLMIEWRGDHVQRVSVGRIHIGAFLTANPVRKNICME